MSNKYIALDNTFYYNEKQKTLSQEYIPIIMTCKAFQIITKKGNLYKTKTF